MEHKKIFISKVMALLLVLIMVLTMMPAAVFADGDSSESGYLSALNFLKSTSKSSQKYDMTPEFSPEQHDYTVYCPDSISNVYIWAKSAQTATISAIYTTVGNEPASIAVKSNNSKAIKLSECISGGSMDGNTVDIAVETEDGTETYHVNIVRKAYLDTLSISDQNSNNYDFNPGFSTQTLSGYIIYVPASAVLTVNADPDVAGSAINVNNSDTMTVTPAWTPERTFGMDITVSHTSGAATTYNVTCIQMPESITVSTSPDKMTYGLGESFETSGMAITAAYADGQSEVLGDADYTYSPSGVLSANDEAITITYKNKTTILPIEISSGFEGDGSENNPFLLKNVDDFTALSEKTAAGESFAACNFKMTADITLPENWTPIGTETTRFQGIIDGDNHLLTIPEGEKAPLGYVRGTTIKNLNIYGTLISGSAIIDKYTVDSGVSLTANIINCTLKSGSKTLYSGFVGGYASGVNTINIIDSTVESGVEIGYDGTKSKIGSFGGEFNGSIINCVSYANVYGKNAVGGIVGIKGQSMGTFDIHDCAFYGTVTATGEFAGGIAGKGYTDATAPNTPCSSIRNCYASGNITASNYAGGIFGGEGGIKVAWNNGVGYIQNNCFYGNVAATTEGGICGGIIGYMNALDRYNAISNNYFVNTCGAEKGIGDVNIIIYPETNSSEGSGWTKVVYDGAIYGRADQPVGVDADKLATSCTALQLTDGTIVKALNTGLNSSGDWKQGTGGPEFKGNKHLISITNSTLSSMNAPSQKIGEDILDGKLLTLKYSDGSTDTMDASLAAKNYTITEDMVGSTILASIVYNNHQLVFGLAIKAGTASTTTPVESTDLNVSFTLLGDEEHGDNGTTHTLRKNNLETWISKTDVTVSKNSTVMTVFAKVLNQNGYSWMNDNKKNSSKGNYIQSISAPDGTTLAEFTNGANSGWMYTLNGTHPEYGVSEQKVSDGDKIIFHYTDDYTKEEGSEKWGGKSYTETTALETETVEKASVTAKVEAAATVGNDGKATVKPAAADITKAIETVAEAAKKDTTATKEVVLTVSGDSKATSLEMTIPKASVTALNSGADKLTISSSVGGVSFDADALKTIAGAATADLKITIAKSESGAVIAKISGLTDEAKASLETKLNDRPVYDFSAMSGNKEISQFGGKVQMNLTYTPASGEDKDALVAYWIKDNGDIEKVIKSGVSADNKHFGIEGDHWSTYAIGYSPVTFDDTASHWAKSSITFLAARDVIKGKSESSFAPNAQITRAEFVQILANMSGDDLTKYNVSKFTDVTDTAWYANAVAWAIEKGIAGGTSDDTFSPDANITRQDMSVMISKYAANVEKESLDAVNTGVTFADAANIASYAKDAVSTMQKAGIISGVKNADKTYSFNPKANATRAEAATMIANYVK